MTERLILPNRSPNDLNQEKCGVFGAKNVEDASRVAYYGLYALQHRGQEYAGIATIDGPFRYIYSGRGLVNQVFQSDEQVASLLGDSAIGHVRYATNSNGSAQPVRGRMLDLGHNGNLPNLRDLRAYLDSKNIDHNNKNDSEMITAAVDNKMAHGASIEDAFAEIFPLMKGSFSIVGQTADTMFAVRDECGIRPISIGKLNGGYIFASETCALDMVGAEFLRDVIPGELVTVNQHNDLKSFQLAPRRDRGDSFEYIYFARPDSVINGKVIYEVRNRLGHQLYYEYPMDADFIVPVPDSAIPAAEGLAEASGIPIRSALIKNRYIGRTFIQPSQVQRRKSVDIKLNCAPEVLKGKRIILVDDSIVRGTTMQRIVGKLLEAGVSEVYAYITSPEIYYPNLLGVDTNTQQELIAFTKSLSEREKYMSLNGLRHLSEPGLERGIGISRDKLCLADFNGDYPVDIGERRQDIRFRIAA